MACNALETYAPNRLNPTMITRNVLMFDILVYVVSQLEKVSPVLEGNAFIAKVVIGFMFWFEPFFTIR